VLKIKYADPPEFIVFSIAPHRRIYALTHKSTAIERRDFLVEIGKEPINAPNIDEWIRINTNNQHSLQTLLDLAEAFRDGYDKAYGIDDIYECGRTVFYIMKDLMYHNGYASKYADMFDIESTPHGELRAKIREEILNNKDDISSKRISRYINVCLHNNLNEAVKILEKVLDRLHEPDDIDFPDSTAYDAEIKKSIIDKLSKAYTRHKQYEQYRRST
jgi:hypothetical protein